MLKYLWVYSAAREDVVQWHNKLIQRRREQGYDIEGFCCTPPYLCDMNWLPFCDLDRLWRIGYPPLMRMYGELLEALKGRNVLVHYNGANLHPEIVKEIDIFKVYTAADDPESTEKLTKPVARYYDLHLINNIACIDMYKGWGLKDVFFWPLGSLRFPEETNLTKEKILDISLRRNQLVYIGEQNIYKKDFFDQFQKRYPSAQCWGNGWPNGYISHEGKYDLYMHSQVGVNIHNSTGPINFRTYELPAHGVMQICDNKSNLGKIFRLNEEVVGFDKSDECMEKVEYYLSHPKEQREIALGGWQRWHQEYTPDAVWKKLAEHVERHYVERNNEYIPALQKKLKDQGKHYYWKKLVAHFRNSK